jgi:hypothetical protein
MQAELNSVPSLIRAVIAKDGRIKANFSDNTVVLLDASGRTFTVRKLTSVPCWVLSGLGSSFGFTLIQNFRKNSNYLECLNHHASVAVR